MFLLIETSGVFQVFKLVKNQTLKKSDNFPEEFESVEKSSELYKLKHFEKFAKMKHLLQSTSDIVNINIDGHNLALKKLFTGEAQEELEAICGIFDKFIATKLNMTCVITPAHDFINYTKINMDTLLGLPPKELTAMTHGVAHGLSRYRFKFSPDKIDKMIIEAVSALDDLDKELNNYIMRCKEWYGWHFPELAKIITDNQLYVKTVLAIGFRENAANVDFSDILSEDDEHKVKELAEISMGTDILEEDWINIRNMCEEVLELQKLRAKLYEYLKNRMSAIAPNVSALVGEMVGARLIAHAGSLVNLAKLPASTVQILGAEKAFCRRLKSRHNTNCGLIYHAQLIVQSPAASKGKMSRMLAAKTASASRVDAFREKESAGPSKKVKIEIVEDKEEQE